MPPTVYRIGGAAARLGVHENTVRLWCAEFASHLSAAANPPSGQVRALSESDLATLERVRDMRNAGYPIAYVRERLPSTTTTTEPSNPPEAPQNAPDAPSGAIMPAAVVQALEALQSRLDAPAAAQALQKAHESGFNRGVAVGVTVAVGVLLGLLLLIGVLSAAGLSWVARLLGGG